MARAAESLSRSLFRSIFGDDSQESSRKSSKSETAPKLPEAPAACVKSGPTLIGEQLERTFGSGTAITRAVQNVSLELHKNELNLLMGPSGSGKTTLLALVSALLRPCGGKVSALGQDIWEMEQSDLENFRLKHCSYVFQGYNLFPALTAREQLEIVLKWGEGASHREARQRSEAVLSQLGLGKKLHLRPMELSGGEKQRVAIGRALVKNPSFLFADEPTSALDWDNGQQVIELLHDVARERGATVLVVTHDPRLLPFADRVFEMADGHLMNENVGNAIDLAPASGYQSHGPHTAGGFPAFQHGKPGQGQLLSPRLTLQEPTARGW